jgi:antitoxin VapB
MLDRTRPGRKVKVFMNGRSRAVRIPKEFEFPGDEVVMRKEDDGTLTLEPVRAKRSPRELVEWLRAQPPLEDEIGEIEDFPPKPVNLDIPE